MRIEFTVPGSPVGKARPKFFRRGNYVGTYTPEKSASFEGLVRLYFGQHYTGAPIEGPISIRMTAYFPIPKSWPKRRINEAMIRCLPVEKKPDIDNILKSVLDGLNGVAFKDDSQVFSVYCDKFYSEKPRTQVAIEVREQSGGETQPSSLAAEAVK